MTPDYRANILDAICDGAELRPDECYSDLIIMGLVKWLSIDEAKRFCEIYEIPDRKELDLSHLK